MFQAGPGQGVSLAGPGWGTRAGCGTRMGGLGKVGLPRSRSKVMGHGL